VKSIEVPDVLATAVPEVITLLAIVVRTALDIAGAVKVLFVSVSVVALPTNVSVATGRVSTLEPDTAGALRVMLPDVSPLTINELIIDTF
jgi:hypothetical protein